MTATGRWTCGCGRPSEGRTCPQCGWERDAPGQPSRVPGRWLPIVAGVLALVLPLDAVAVLAHDSRPVLFTKTGHVIGRVSNDQDAGLPPAHERVLPADLATLVPAPPDGYRAVPTSPASGALDLDALVHLGQGSATAVAVVRSQLQADGFVRAQAQTFASPTARLVVGVILLQFDTAEHARSYLRFQRSAVAASGQPVLHDAPAGLTFQEGTAPGTTGRPMDVVYPVDQLVVQEFAASPDRDATEADFNVLHDAVTRSLSLS